MLEADKVMFEIYKENTCNDRYQVVYFTELDEHNRDAEIDRAFAGEHFYDGFIRDQHKEQAKRIISNILERLNEGEVITLNEVQHLLADYAA